MRFSILIVLCALVLPTFAQHTSHFSNTQPPVLKGKLIGYDPIEDKDLELKCAIVLPSPTFQLDTFLPIASDGSFELQLLYPLHNQQVWFILGDHYFGQLMMDKGLTVTADLKALKAKESKGFNDEDVQFSGPDGPMTAYLNQFTSYRSEQEDWPEGELMSIMQDREAAPADKVKKMKDMHQKIEIVRERFFKLYPSEFEYLLTNEQESDLYSWMTVFYWGKEMPEELLTEILAHQPQAISNASHSYFGYLANYSKSATPQERLKAFKTEVLPHIESPAEANRLQYFIKIYANKIAGQPYDEAIFKGDNKYFSKQYKDELELAKLKNLKADLKEAKLDPEVAALIILNGGSEDIWAQDLYMKTMLPAIEVPWAAEIMEKEWAKNKVAIESVNKKLAKIKIPEKATELGTPQGELEDGTTFYLAEQDNIETLLAAIRADHPGKAILLDIWATWCGPCIYDMKEGKANKDKLKEMGVEVVYLCSSSGSNPDLWKKKVTELQVNTQHFFLSDALSKEIMDYFNLNGYPSHIFLDVNGQMVPNVINGLRNVDFDKVKENIGQ